MSDMYEITFTFVSGNETTYKFDEHNKEVVLETLRSDWMGSSLTNDNFGINFHYVTKYYIKKID